MKRQKTKWSLIRLIQERCSPKTPRASLLPLQPYLEHRQFVLSADLALYLPFQEHVLVLVHSLTGSSNILYLVIHYLGGLLLLCAAPGRISSVRLHIYVCLPARGRDCGRDLLACRLASGLLLAAYVSSAHVQVWHSFQLFQAACCVCRFHG
jgi:hypothetical protein